MVAPPQMGQLMGNNHFPLPGFEHNQQFSRQNNYRHWVEKPHVGHGVAFPLGKPKAIFQTDLIGQIIGSR